MVGVLIAMKFAMLRHTSAGLRKVGWVFGGLALVATWAAAVGAGGDEPRSEVLMLLFAGWGVGALIGPVSLSGSGVLRADYFTLLPLDRRRLALGLLAATFPGIASAMVLLAYLSGTVSAVALGRTGGPTSTLTLVLVAITGAALLWVVTIVAGRVLFGLLGAAMRSWLGIEISALQFGVVIAGLMVGWMIIARAFSTVPVLLAEGLPDGSALNGLTALPTSWPVLAVDAAAAGNAAAAAGWLVALVGLAVALLALAAYLLRPHLGSAANRPSRPPVGRRVLTRPGILPDTALGAVVGKELRQWWRDPWRALELRTGIYTGLLIGLFGYLSVDYRIIAPLAGLAIAFMICLAACNLFGQDGTAIWLSVVGERTDTAWAEIRGRQLAVVLLFLPPAVVVSAVLLLASGAYGLLPVVLAGLPALFGVASGVALVMSVAGVSPGVDPRRRVGPNDAGGDLGLQGQLAFWITVLLVLPTAAALTIGYLSGSPAGPWLAVAVGVANGVLGGWLLGRAAVAYLEPRLPTVFTRIRYARREAPADESLLARLEAASQRSEDAAREAKLKQRRARAEARAAG